MKELGILFDLDGTLLDTLEDLRDGVNYALSQFGYPSRSLEEVRRFVGNGARRLIDRAVPEGTAVAERDQVFACFQEYYGNHCQRKTGPYAGVLEALEQLDRAGYRIGIVSNKPDGAVKTLCAQYFPGIFARGEDSDCPRKPDPAMVYQAAKELGVAPERCVYVGDSEVDLRTGENAGMDVISVTWGFRDIQELRAAGGIRFCHTPEKLIDYVKELEQNICGK